MKLLPGITDHVLPLSALSFHYTVSTWQVRRIVYVWYSVFPFLTNLYPSHLIQVISPMCKRRLSRWPRTWLTTKLSDRMQEGVQRRKWVFKGRGSGIYPSRFSRPPITLFLFFSFLLLCVRHFFSSLEQEQSEPHIPNPLPPTTKTEWFVKNLSRSFSPIPETPGY